MDASVMSDKRDNCVKRLQHILDGQEQHGILEGDHVDADDALLDLIDDPEVRELYDRIEKWYA